MDSRLKTAAVMLTATALSGVAYYFASDMFPPWWTMWVAALPVLWAAARMSWWQTTTIALVARGIGGLSAWSYRADTIKFPLWLNVTTVLVPAVGFTVAVLFFRAFIKRRQPWLAILAFPLLSVASEYLSSQILLGSFGNTAYTQMDNILVLQIGALAGIWGISFVVQLLAPMIATITAPAIPPGARRQLTITLVVTFTAVFGYGTWRTWATPAAPASVRVGLLASDVDQNVFPTSDQDVMRLMHDYANQAKTLAAQDVKIVVLPEMTALVHDSVSSDIDTLFEQVARGAHTQILLGVLHVTGPSGAPSAAFNEARLYSDSGASTVVYRKHHLVPVLEGQTTPGDRISTVSQPLGKIGLEICRDMDYSDPARLYGQQGVGLLLVPAWDMSVDRWWHGHMALMRGVENGYSIVRVAKRGFLTVSDDRGRVLAEATNTPEHPFTTLTATVPVRHDTTLYQSWGDWFAWLALAGSAALVLLQFRPMRSVTPIPTLAQ